jgi:hypothetical protein
MRAIIRLSRLWKIDNDTPLLDFQTRLMVCEVVLEAYQTEISP